MKFVGSFLFVIIICLILYAFAMFQGGFVSWFLFFSFLPIFVYQIGLLSYPIRFWKVTRTFATSKVCAGDDLHITIHMKRKLPFPLYYCVIEEAIPPTLMKIDQNKQKYIHLYDPKKRSIHRRFKRIIFPWFRRKIDISYVLNNVPRGEHQLHMIRVKTTDIFGFVMKENLFHIEDELLVYPANRAVRLTNEIASLEQGARPSSSFQWKQTNIVSGVREYVAGDKVSWIDWKQTARQQQMMTKEFEQEKSNYTLCVLDACQHENLNELAFDGSIELSLAFIKEIQKQSAPINFLPIGKQAKLFSLKERSENQVIEEHLARIHPSKAEAFSKRLLSLDIDRHTYALIVIVTTIIDQSLITVLKHMKKHTKSITIILIQSTINQTHQEEMMKQLQYEGIKCCLLTEKELVNDQVEVNI